MISTIAAAATLPRARAAQQGGLATQPPTVSPSVEGDISGRSFGEEELALLKRVILSGTLNCTKRTGEFESKFASLGMPVPPHHDVGPAASTRLSRRSILSPATIITSPITDMGAITPIPYQTAIPVFADVDPLTYNVRRRPSRRRSPAARGRSS